MVNVERRLERQTHEAANEKPHGEDMFGDGWIGSSMKCKIWLIHLQCMMVYIVHCCDLSIKVQKV